MCHYEKVGNAFINISSMFKHCSEGRFSVYFEIFRECIGGGTKTGGEKEGKVREKENEGTWFRGSHVRCGENPGGEGKGKVRGKISWGTGFRG